MHRVTKLRDEIRIYVPTVPVASALGNSDGRVLGSVTPLSVVLASERVFFLISRPGSTS